MLGARPRVKARSSGAVAFDESNCVESAMTKIGTLVRASAGSWSEGGSPALVERVNLISSKLKKKYCVHSLSPRARSMPARTFLLTVAPLLAAALMPQPLATGALLAQPLAPRSAAAAARSARSPAVFLSEDGGAAARQSQSVRYITEGEMEEAVRTAALEQGLPAAEAQMYASCSRNIYGIGCVYPNVTLASIEEILLPAAKAGEGWALLMLQCARGKLPRLRSEGTALARMRAARGAAARRMQQARSS